LSVIKKTREFLTGIELKKEKSLFTLKSFIFFISLFSTFFSIFKRLFLHFEGFKREKPSSLKRIAQILSLFETADNEIV
jgi:hypothetical protein